jgi:hypothetical protein
MKWLEPFQMGPAPASPLRGIVTSYCCDLHASFALNPPSRLSTMAGYMSTLIRLWYNVFFVRIRASPTQNLATTDVQSSPTENPHPFFTPHHTAHQGRKAQP